MSSIHPTIQKKLHLILHRAFVEARDLANNQRCQQLYDLADTLEVIPVLLDRWEEGHLSYVRGILASYRTKYGPSAFDYVAILDMNDADFDTVFGRAAVS
jgi:hypothetical protein